MLDEVQLTNFTSGELSKRFTGRIDQQKYFNGLDTALNIVPMLQGGATKRPGSLFVALALAQTPLPFYTRNVRFQFSVIQPYMLAVSAGFIRVMMDDGVVLNVGVPVDIAVPYAAADLAALTFTQSTDTLYIFHPNYPPAKLGRSSHTNWTYAALTILDGPYLTANTTTTTLTPSGTGGAITLTASSIVGINVTPQSTGQGFLATDVGRLVRIKVGTAWGWCLITAVTDTTHVNAAVQPAVNGGAAGALDGTTATVNWRLGKWSATTGYPYLGTFWQQRLFMLGTNNEPNAVEGSSTADFYNMAPSAADGTVAATNALSWIISDDQVNALRWVSAAGSAQGAQLGMGTLGSEHIFQAATTSQALTPTNVQTYRETAYGSAPNVPALRIGKSVLFTNRPGRTVHEWTFLWQVNGYIGPDLCEFSEHITRPNPVSLPGIVAWDYQQSPHKVIYAVLGDGSLISFTYDKEQTIFAPARHQLGGNWYGGPPFVESVSCMPSQDGTYDEVWLSVLRTINGTPKRTIEVLTRYFDGMPLDQAFFVDCGLSSDLTFPAAGITPTGFTNDQPATRPPRFSGTGALAADADVFSAGSVGSIVRLNNGVMKITGYTDARHVTARVRTPLTNLAPALVNAWSCTALQTLFSGFDHLVGETVALLGDGAYLGTQIVAAGGTVTIAKPGVSLLTGGLSYSPVLVTMPFEPARAAAAASQGKTKRVDTLYLRFYETLGAEYGMRMTDDMTKAQTDKIEPLKSRSASDNMGGPPALFTGAKRLHPQGGFDREGQIIVTQNEPMPMTALSVIANAEIGEVRGVA